MKKKPTIPNWIVFMSILFIFLCLYVFLSCKVIAIGYKMEEAKKRYEDLEMLNKYYKSEILKLTSQAELLKKAESFNMHLVNPSKWCYLEIEPDNSEGKSNGKAEAGTR